MARPSNRLVLSLSVHFLRVKIVPSEERRGILLRCLRRSYINCLSPLCSKNLHRKDTFRILRKVEIAPFLRAIEKNLHKRQNLKKVLQLLFHPYFYVSFFPVRIISKTSSSDNVTNDS